MRLLLTFLFLIVMQSFVVCTQDDGTITFAQKLVNKTGGTKRTSVILAKKGIHNFVEIQSFKISERINQLVFKHIALVKYASNTKAISFLISLNSIKQIGDKIDFSYLYIFDCLYPKYSFW